MVDLQIHGVSEPTRRTLSGEARARGESLQEYLLDILDREARNVGNRQVLAEWASSPLRDEAPQVGFVKLIGSERQRQPT